MKRFLILLLSVALVAVIVGCGSSEQAAATPIIALDPSPAPTQPPVPTAVPPTLPPPVVAENTRPPEPTAVPEPTAEPEPEAPAVRVWDQNQFGYGIQSHALIGDPSYAMEVTANQLGLNWVKVQMRWAFVERNQGEFDWGIWDSIVKEADARDLHLMFSVVTSPAWSRATGNEHGPPDDVNLYYNFLSELIGRYPGKIHALEIWNEQNLDREWQTDLGVAPIDYVNFLAGAYSTVKNLDPNIVVISGALAPTGAHDPNKITFMNDLIWFDEAITLGILDHLDCVGVHHNGYNLPPDVPYDDTARVGSADDYSFKGPWANPHPSWSFKTTIDAMADKSQAVRPGAKVCVTEFGWASSEGYDELPVGFEYAADNTLEEQAQFITQAYKQMYDSGDVMLAFLFNLDFGNKGNGPTDDNVPYSIVDTSGIPRPAFGAISAMEKTP